MVFSVILLVVILIWVLLQNLFRKEQMTGKEAKLLKLWRKVKKFIAEWWSSLSPRMSWAIIALIVFMIFIILWTTTGLFDWLDTGHHYPNS